VGFSCDGICNLSLKEKPSGLPDSNVIFFVATKPTGSIIESEAKESLALRWACLAQDFLVASVSSMNL
jgi:hypothetical protein